MQSTLTVDQLLSLGGSDRQLRAYAYLQVALESGSSSGHTADDVLDCFIPFVEEAMRQQVGKQVDLQELQAYLKKFSFDLPIYALDQMMPRLQKLGAVEWNSNLKIFVVTHRSGETGKISAKEADNFNRVIDGVDAALADFALTEFSKSTPHTHPDWGSALVDFLKSGTDTSPGEVGTINGVLISDVQRLDYFICAKFIRHAFDQNRIIFDGIVKIFSGILIEDFIRTIQEYAPDADYRNISVIYDTTILLRLLKTSGKELYIATTEMHRAIEDLGCKTFFFSHTEQEVSNILSGININLAMSREIWGETAEALMDGEVTTSQLKDLEGTFETRLGQLNIFESKYNYGNTKTANFFQINESGFKDFLSSKAAELGRGYSGQNLDHDAQSLALIMRLRHGHTTKDFENCKFVFVTTNRLLSKAAREYLVGERQLTWSSVPPMFTTGQMATLAWMATKKSLLPALVSKELLANCYNALRPDDQWLPQFANAMEKFKLENPDVISDLAESAVFTQTVRRIAQDRSYGDSALLKKMNIVDAFSTALKVVEERKREESQKIRDETSALLNAEFASRQIVKADRWAHRSIIFMKALLAIIFATSLLLNAGMRFIFTSPDGTSWSSVGLIVLFISGLISLVSALDLFGVNLASNAFHFIESRFRSIYIMIFKI